MARREWLLQGYYADDAAPPKKPGELAIEVGGASREALDMDLAVLRARGDIGEIIGPFEVSR